MKAGSSRRLAAGSFENDEDGDGDGDDDGDGDGDGKLPGGGAAPARAGRRGGCGQLGAAASAACAARRAVFREIAAAAHSARRALTPDRATPEQAEETAAHIEMTLQELFGQDFERLVRVHNHQE